VGKWVRGGSGQDGTEDGRGWNNILKKGKKGGKKKGRGGKEKIKKGRKRKRDSVYY